MWIQGIPVKTFILKIMFIITGQVGILHAGVSLSTPELSQYLVMY